MAKIIAMPSIAFLMRTGDNFCTIAQGLLEPLLKRAPVSLPKAERKRLQVQHAPSKSLRAKVLKLADKISNVIAIGKIRLWIGPYSANANTCNGAGMSLPVCMARRPRSKRNRGRGGPPHRGQE
jgi:hypothetical protein